MYVASMSDFTGKYAINNIGNDGVSFAFQELANREESRILRMLLGVEIYNKIANGDAMPEGPLHNLVYGADFSLVYRGKTHLLNWSGLKSVVVPFIFVRYNEENAVLQTNGVNYVPDVKDGQTIPLREAMRSYWNEMIHAIGTVPNYGYNTWEYLKRSDLIIYEVVSSLYNYMASNKALFPEFRMYDGFKPLSFVNSWGI